MKPQVDFIFEKDGTLLVDRIGHLESIEKTLVKLLVSLVFAGSKLKFYANRSKRKSIDHYYD